MTSGTRSTILVLIGLGLAAGPAMGQSSPSARGESIAKRLCARCHAVGETGASPMGLAPPFRDLSKRYPIETLAEALAEGIVVGHPAMPGSRLNRARSVPCSPTSPHSSRARRPIKSSNGV
jgi:cytochrome c